MLVKLHRSDCAEPKTGSAHNQELELPPRACIGPLIAGIDVLGSLWRALGPLKPLISRCKGSSRGDHTRPS
jgi:hypothetical protein